MNPSSSQSEILQFIPTALDPARAVFGGLTSGAIDAECKIGHGPITEADSLVNAVLGQNLLRDGEVGFPRNAPTIFPLAKKPNTGSRSPGWHA